MGAAEVVGIVFLVIIGGAVVLGAIGWVLTKIAEGFRH